MLADEAAFTKWFEQHLERLMLLLLRYSEFDAYERSHSEHHPD